MPSFSFLASVPVVHEQQIGRNLRSQSNRFSLSFVEIHLPGETMDGALDFKPVRTLGHPAAHGFRSARLIQLVGDSGRDQNTFVERRQ